MKHTEFEFRAKSSSQNSVLLLTKKGMNENTQKEVIFLTSICSRFASLSNGVSENAFDIPLGTVRRVVLFEKDTYDTKRQGRKKAILCDLV